MAHQVSTTWSDRLAQNIPVCPMCFLPAAPLDMRDFFAGLSRRSEGVRSPADWRDLRFKCIIWVQSPGAT